MAADIAAEEGKVAERLEQCFDAAVEVSLSSVEPEDLEQTLVSYLRDDHALEEQGLKLLASSAGRVEDEELEIAFRRHIGETRKHIARIEGLLEERDEKPSSLKDTA